MPRRTTKRKAPVEEPLIEEIDIEEEEEAQKTPSPKKSKAAPAKKGKVAKPKSPAKKAKAAPASKKTKNDEETDEEFEYEVERIIDMKVRNGVKLYEVKWKGFSNSRNTWEPEENLVGSQDLVDAFNAKVDKSDVSRARRLTTINSTKSSSTNGTRRPSVSRRTTPAVQPSSRVTRSRSRTPSRNTHAPIASSNLKHKSSPSDKAKTRQTSVQKFMDESLTKKLDRIKAARSKSEPKKVEGKQSKQKPSSAKPSPTKSQKSSSSKRNGPTSSSASSKSSDATSRRSARREQRPAQPSLFAKAARYCGVGAAAVSAGLGALLYTQPQIIDWNHGWEQARILLENLQGGYSGSAGSV